MGRVKKTLLILACCAAGVAAALTVWDRAVGRLDEDNYGQYVRLELGWGPFPLKVLEVSERKDGGLQVYEP